MKYEQALAIVERQMAMLARIHEDHRAYQIRCRARLAAKIEAGEPLDTLEFCTAQGFGLLDARGKKIDGPG